MSTPSRRSFLHGVLRGATAVALVGCTTEGPPESEPSSATPAPTAGPPPLPEGLQRAHFEVYNERPLALETRREALGSGVITPNSRFFVRNNLPRPSERILDSRLDWVVDIAGVTAPAALTLRQLMQFPWVSTAAVIQCSGNGRRFFEHGPSGSPWGTGAAGCALWTGVRVADVIAHLGGALDEGTYLTATGGEPLPEGVERDTVVVERSIPIEKGLRDALLVWEMNGEPLPLTHGGPVRLLVPGYFGCNQIKYVKRLAAAAEQTQAKIQRSGYRFRDIGQSGGPDQPSLWRMPVKSWINGPGADGTPVLAGAITLYGVALSGERGIRAVEVSVDGGTTWQPAELTGPDLGPNAWRTFSFRSELPPGTHTVVSRAIDAEGEVQPEVRVENERGYRHNGWRDHALTLRVSATIEATQSTPSAITEPEPGLDAPAQPVELSAAGERGKVVFNETASPSCTVCHSLADSGAQGAVGPDLNALAPDAQRVATAVREGVGAMPSFGSTLTEGQIADVAAYVVEATR